MARRAEQRDENEPDIVSGLEAVGVTVDRLPGGGGRPDLLVGYRGQTYLMEVKNLNAGKPGDRVRVGDLEPDGKYYDLWEEYGNQTKWLKKTQARWFSEWQGSRPFIVMTVDEALAAIGITVKKEAP